MPIRPGHRGFAVRRASRMYNVRLVPFCHLQSAQLCKFRFECALINVTICWMVLTDRKAVWYYIQGQIKKDKRTTQESKTQAPPPNGSGACFLFFTQSFPSRPVPGSHRKFQEISQNFLVAPDGINWDFWEMDQKASGTEWSERPSTILDFFLCLFGKFRVPLDNSWCRAQQELKKDNHR